MKHSKRKILILSFCMVALCAILLIPSLQQPEPDLQHTVTNAISFFDKSDEPYALLWLDVIHRRFGIDEFADSLERYDQLLAENPEQAPLLRLFRRIADHDNPLQTEDLNALYAEVDYVTVPALYCDQLGLSKDYPELLDTTASIGNYKLTHVLLAWIWIQENGYDLQLPDGFIDDIYSDVAALIGDDHVVEDLELEAAAFLYLAGQGALVDEAFVEHVIAVQNEDGGWSLSSADPGDSDWHSTILALLLLLHVEFPVDSYPPMLAPASP